MDTGQNSYADRGESALCTLDSEELGLPVLSRKKLEKRLGSMEVVPILLEADDHLQRFTGDAAKVHRIPNLRTAFFNYAESLPLMKSPKKFSALKRRCPTTYQILLESIYRAVKEYGFCL